MDKKYRIALGLVFALACAFTCAQGFPLCLYGVDSPQDIPVVKAAGFNCVQTYKKDADTIKALAQAAQKENIKIVVYPNNIINSPYQKEAQNWPVLAWYLADEPDVVNMSRKRLKELNINAKTAFPDDKTTFVIGRGETKIPYYDITDILMVDWYPVPHLNLESLGEQVALVKKYAPNASKPVWAVVQAFNWKEYPQNRPENDKIGRFPTQEEIKFMSLDALLNGADGLFYFVYTSNGVPLPKSNPEGWQALSNTVKMMQFAAPALKWGSRRINPTISKPPIVMKTFYYDYDTYTLVMNYSARQSALPAVLKQSKYEVIFGEKSDILDGYDVLLLRHKRPMINLIGGFGFAAL